MDEAAPCGEPALQEVRPVLQEGFPTARQLVFTVPPPEELALTAKPWRQP